MLFCIRQQLEIYAFQLLNGNGDLLDLVNKVSPKDQEDWRTMSKDEVLSLVARNGHCSALIKVTNRLTLYLTNKQTLFHLSYIEHVKHEAYVQKRNYYVVLWQQ